MRNLHPKGGNEKRKSVHGLNDLYEGPEERCEPNYSLRYEPSDDGEPLDPNDERDAWMLKASEKLEGLLKRDANLYGGYVGVIAETYDKWLDWMAKNDPENAFETSVCSAGREPRAARDRDDDKEPAPVQAYARLPRPFCKRRQPLKPFVVGVLGAVLIHAKRRGAKGVTRRKLLQIAGSDTSGTEMQNLNAALDALLEPVLDKFPAPLCSYGMGQLLTLEVDAAWLPESNYVKVPWPPPKDALALSLYLWLASVTPKFRDKRYTPLRELRSLLGYTRDHFQRDLKTALAAVNIHRAKLDLRPYAMMIKGPTVCFNPSRKKRVRTAENGRGVKSRFSRGKKP